MSGDSRPMANLAGLLDELREHLPTLPMRVLDAEAAILGGQMLVRRSRQGLWEAINTRTVVRIGEYPDAQTAVLHAAQQAIVEQLERCFVRPAHAA